MFPEKKLGFLVFSNLGSYQPGLKAMAMADLFLANGTDTLPKAKDAPRDSSHAALKDPSSLQKYLGDYVSDDGGKRMRLRMHDNKLYCDISNRTELMMKTDDTLSSFNHPESRGTFSIPRPGDTLMTAFSPTEKQVYRKYRPLPQTEQVLKTFTGAYYCSELE